MDLRKRNLFISLILYRGVMLGLTPSQAHAAVYTNWQGVLKNSGMCLSVCLPNMHMLQCIQTGRVC